MDLITIVILILIAAILIYTYKLPIMCYGCESPSGVSAHIFRCIIDTTENSPLCNISKGINELSNDIENGQNLISRAVFSELTKGIPETIQTALANIMIKIEELMGSIIQTLTDLPVKLAEYLKTGFDQIKNTVIKNATVVYKLLLQPIIDYIVNYIIDPISALIKTLLDFKQLITDAINKSVKDVSGVFLNLQNNVINAIAEIPQAIQDLINCVIDSLNVTLNTVGQGGFNTVLQPIINTINPIVTNVLPLIDTISGSLNTVTKSTDQVLGAIKGVSGSVESVTGALSSILSKLKDNLVPVTGALTTITNNALTTLNAVKTPTLVNSLVSLDTASTLIDTNLLKIPDIGVALDSVSDLILGGYSVEKNVDYGGNDIKSLTNSTLKQCKDDCNGNSSCLGFNHSNPTDNGTCWIKHKLGVKSTNNEWTFYTKNSGLLGIVPKLATTLSNTAISGLKLAPLLITGLDTARDMLTLTSKTLLQFNNDGKLKFSLLGSGTPFDGSKDRCGISRGGPLSQVNFKEISKADHILSGTKVSDKMGEPFKVAASQIYDAYNGLMAPINNAIVLLTSFAATVVESIRMLFTKYFNMDYLNAMIAKIQTVSEVTVQMVLDIIYNEIIIPIFEIVSLIKDKIQDGINFVISALVNTFKMILSQIKSVFSVISDSLYNAGKFIINNAGYMAFYYMSESIDKMIPLPIQKTGKLTIVYYALLSLVIVYLYMYIAHIEFILMLTAGIALVTGILYFTLPPP